MVALERIGVDCYVYVFEVKRRPRAKLAEQLRRRVWLADYIYAAVPFPLYSWALRVVDPSIGVAVVNRGWVSILRKSRYFGNGRKLLEILDLYR